VARGGQLPAIAQFQLGQLLKIRAYVKAVRDWWARTPSKGDTVIAPLKEWCDGFFP